jgi:hypothetical protein
MSASNPTLGISASSIVIGSKFVCTFTRDNSNANPNYFNINTNAPYIITAYGPMTQGRKKILDE